MNGPWVNGILANHVWSFAGGRDRDAVSQSTLEPVISYNFENGWFLAFDSTMTADWNAPADKRWTIPVGLDAGKTLQVGQRSLSLQFGTYYNIERAEGAGPVAHSLSSITRFPKAPCVALNPCCIVEHASSPDEEKGLQVRLGQEYAKSAENSSPCPPLKRPNYEDLRLFYFLPKALWTCASS
jgi:hypothetical protein